MPKKSGIVSKTIKAMSGNTGKTINPTSSIKSFEKGEKMKMKKGGMVKSKKK